MGVDSGLPDFRGSTGLFKDREVAMTYEARCAPVLHSVT